MNFELGGAVFWDEAVFLSRRKHLETTARYRRANRRGLVMQFILDLIWTQSRSKYLAAMGQPEAEH
jgi:hypothetical protein